jgi:alkylated DNA repair dioxygenase AlkB
MKTTINHNKSFSGKHIDHFDGLKDISKLGAGDSYYIKKFMTITEETFLNLLKEINFVQMYNFTPNSKTTEVIPIPRLVSAQTDKSVQDSAHYRMPGCNQGNIPTTDWSPTVLFIKNQAEIATGQKINHCVINLYFDENDSLAFHKDNLLDLEPNTGVISVSIGQSRPFLFNSTDTNHKQDINLQNGSLLYIGTKTNKRYVHSVPKLTNKVEPRLSLTFRHISTYINETENKVSGLGDLYQTKDYPFTKSYSGEFCEEMLTIETKSFEKLTYLIQQLELRTSRPT